MEENNVFNKRIEKRKRFGLADILFWLAIAILIIWAIAKSFFIHSEPWQIYLPVALTIILFALSFWERIGTYTEKINNYGFKLDKIESKIDDIDKRLIGIETEHRLFTNKKLKIKH